MEEHFYNRSIQLLLDGYWYKVADVCLRIKLEQEIMSNVPLRDVI